MGKSTLLDIVAGLRAPHSGHVRFRGQDLHHMPGRMRAREIGHLPQGTRQDLPFRVEEVVLMGRYAFADRWFESFEDHACADDAMRRMNCIQFRERLYSTLSGEQQRVLLAACVAQCPRLMLFDEPPPISTYISSCSAIQRSPGWRGKARSASQSRTITIWRSRTARRFSFSTKASSPPIYRAVKPAQIANGCRGCHPACVWRKFRKESRGCCIDDVAHLIAIRLGLGIGGRIPACRGAASVGRQRSDQYGARLREAPTRLSDLHRVAPLSHFAGPACERSALAHRKPVSSDAARFARDAIHARERRLCS